MKIQPIPSGSVITRNLAWQEDSAGLVTVCKPFLGNSRIGMKITEALGFDDYRIRLDRTGSIVWKLCDGRTGIEAIRERIEESFPEEDPESLDDRLTAFLHKMNRSGMITILSPER